MLNSYARINTHNVFCPYALYNSICARSKVIVSNICRLFLYVVCPSRVKVYTHYGGVVFLIFFFLITSVTRGCKNINLKFKLPKFTGVGHNTHEKCSEMALKAPSADNADKDKIIVAAITKVPRTRVKKVYNLRLRYLKIPVTSRLY